MSQPRITIDAEGELERDLLLEVLAADGLHAEPHGLGATEIEALPAVAPAVLIMAADMRRPASSATLRSVHRTVPATCIVVVAPDDEGGNVARHALNAGAEAFVPRQCVHTALVPAVRAVLAGLVCAPRRARRVIAKPTFSHREKEILRLVVTGLTNRQIADRLFLSESTVKTHLVSAFAKLGVRSRKDAAERLLDPAEGFLATVLGILQAGAGAPTAAVEAA